jgi:hypothetical protein
MMSVRTRDLLIRHMDKPIEIPFGREHSMMRAVVSRAIVKGWIEPVKYRPKFTQLTEAGRNELAKALANWAEAIQAAQSLAEVRAEHKELASAGSTGINC